MKNDKHGRTVEIKQIVKDTGAMPMIVSFLNEGVVQKEMAFPGLVCCYEMIECWIMDGILP